MTVKSIFGVFCSEAVICCVFTLLTESRSNTWAGIWARNILTQSPEKSSLPVQFEPKWIQCRFETYIIIYLLFPEIDKKIYTTSDSLKSDYLGFSHTGLETSRWPPNNLQSLARNLSDWQQLLQVTRWNQLQKQVLQELSLWFLWCVADIIFY